jgi:hypothetical protein
MHAKKNITRAMLYASDLCLHTYSRPPYTTLLPIEDMICGAEALAFNLSRVQV